MQILLLFTDVILFLIKGITEYYHVQQCFTYSCMAIWGMRNSSCLAYLYSFTDFASWPLFVESFFLYLRYESFTSFHFRDTVFPTMRKRTKKAINSNFIISTIIVLLFQVSGLLYIIRKQRICSLIKYHYSIKFSAKWPLKLEKRPRSVMGRN